MVGGSGYIGGELLRLLLCHPNVTVAQVTSRKLRGHRIDSAHPNLRGRTELAFCAPDELTDCDVLLLATPHRDTMAILPSLSGLAPYLVDLSGDFRLRDTSVYERYYGTAHTAPELIDDFTPGIPELHRKRLRDADRVSVPGCMATAAILALVPLADAGLVEPSVVVDARTGSSGSGSGAGTASSHAERSGAMRVFAPAGHRHEAEIGQHTGMSVRMSATGVEAVRGVQVVCHARARAATDEKTIRRAYRERYADEPFVRIVAHKRGTHRYPDPKVLLGSNYCDVGFALGPADSPGDPADPTDPDSPAGPRITAMGALDNLVKGGAGAAVQCLNLRMGWPEQLGLDFPGLHPV